MDSHCLPETRILPHLAARTWRCIEVFSAHNASRHSQAPLRAVATAMIYSLAAAAALLPTTLCTCTLVGTLSVPRSGGRAFVKRSASRDPAAERSCLRAVRECEFPGGLRTLKRQLRVTHKLILSLFAR